MPRILLILNSLALIVMLTACNLADAPEETLPAPSLIEPVTITQEDEIQTEEAAVTVPVDPTPEPILQSVPAALPACTPRTDWPTYTVVRGDTAFSIARASGTSTQTLAAANCLGDPSQISAGQVLYVPTQPQFPPTQPTTGEAILAYYLVSPQPVPGQESVGCDNGLVKAPSGIAASSNPADNIRAILNALFAMPSAQVGQSGLTNFWAGMNLQVSDLRIDGSSAVVTIQGDFLLGGVCGVAAMIPQLVETIFAAAPDLERVRIMVNGQNLTQHADMSGFSASPDDYYTRTG